MNTSLSTAAKGVAQSILGCRCYGMLVRGYWHWRAPWDPKHRASKRRMAALKDSHRGERCFIIGNGPSLRNMDLSYLRKEVTFGLNRIYMIFEQIGFATSYYVCVNRLVVEQCSEEIIQLVPCPKFISLYACDLIDFTADMMLVNSQNSFRFFTDITEGVGEGATVTYVAMQIAYYLGFQKVILIGVDHSYSTTGDPHTTAVSKGDDPNHFAPDYFGKGFRWQLPDLEGSELAYRTAKHHFESRGREILDATVGGKLQVFRKVDYRTLFS